MGPVGFLQSGGVPYVGREERLSDANFQTKTILGSQTMTDDLRREALAAWYKLLAQPEIRMDVEE
jgi:hypothetical protein